MAKKTKIEVGPDDMVVGLYSGDELTDIRYGRWNNLTPQPGKDASGGRYLVPGRLSGSDYSGSLVERSNYKAFSKEFAAGEGEWWTDAPGGHGTFAIVVDTESVPEDVEEDVANFLNGLHDYGLADEDEHSSMEMEAQQEAWDNWGRKEFKQSIEKKFDVELDEVDESKLDEIFEESREAANVYWVNESGDSMYIDMKRIVAKVSKEDVKQLLES